MPNKETVEKTLARKDALLAGRSTAQLIQMWELTELPTKPSREMAMVRGWIMEELAKRDPLAYDAWIEGYYGDDAGSAKRAFVRPHFYYIDETTMEVSEYESERAFWDGILWNRDVAEEYGDEVPSESELREHFRGEGDKDEHINGAYFVKTMLEKEEMVKAEIL